MRPELVLDPHFYRPAAAPIAPIACQSSILTEHAQSLRRLVAENSRECIHCYAAIDSTTQEKNGGACDACADIAELTYWDDVEASYFASLA